MLQCPSTLELTSCKVYTTHAASGIHTNASTMEPQLPPALRPIYFCNYSSEAGLSQPYFRRDITNLFGLPEPRPSQRGEPIGTTPTTMVCDCQAPVLHQQAPENPSLLDSVRELLAPRPTAASDPMEVQRETVMVTRQLMDTTGAPQVVPDTECIPGTPVHERFWLMMEPQH